MATSEVLVTYTNGAESGSGVSWTNPSNIWDGNNTTLGSCIIRGILNIGPPLSFTYESSKTITVNTNDNTCDDEDWDISTVYAIITGKTSSVDTIGNPLFKTAMVANSKTFSSVPFTTTKQDILVDITTARTSWTWDDIDNLDIAFTFTAFVPSTTSTISLYQIGLKVVCTVPDPEPPEEPPEPPPEADETYGIEIYDEDSNLIFSLSDRIFRVFHVERIDNSTITSEEFAIGYTEDMQVSQVVPIIVTAEEGKFAQVVNSISTDDSTSGIMLMTLGFKQIGQGSGVIVYGDYPDVHTISMFPTGESVIVAVGKS